MPDDDKRILSRLMRNMHNRGEDPLTPIIDEYILTRDRSDARVPDYHVSLVERIRPGGRLSPSSIGGCLRQAAFRFVAMEGRRKKDPQRELIFDEGNWHHAKWQYRMLDAQAVLGEDKIKVLATEGHVIIPELYIAGYTDNWLRLQLLNGKKRRFVVDWKSINDNGFQHVSRQDQPLEEHVKQLTTYGKGLGAKWGIILYDNKNNQEFKVFVIEFQNATWMEVAEWCEEVIRFLDNEELPPMHPDCDAGNFLYNRCAYAHHCFGTSTPVKIQRRMYKDFPGVEEAWQEGHRLAGTTPPA